MLMINCAWCLFQTANLSVVKPKYFYYFQVDEGTPPYPRSTALWWFYCKSASSQNTTTEAPAALAARELADEDEDNRNITVIRIHSDSGHL